MINGINKSSSQPKPQLTTLTEEVFKRQVTVIQTDRISGDDNFFPFLDLPWEIWRNEIFKNLTSRDVLALFQTCKEAGSICNKSVFRIDFWEWSCRQVKSTLLSEVLQIAKQNRGLVEIIFSSNDIHEIEALIKALDNFQFLYSRIIKLDFSRTKTNDQIASLAIPLLRNVFNLKELKLWNIISPTTTLDLTQYSTSNLVSLTFNIIGCKVQLPSKLHNLQNLAFNNCMRRSAEIDFGQCELDSLVRLTFTDINCLVKLPPNLPVQELVIESLRSHGVLQGLEQCKFPNLKSFIFNDSIMNLDI